MILAVRAFALAVLAVMTWVTVVASLDRGVFSAASELWQAPWFRATLADAYFGFLSVYLWIFYRETSATRRGLWLVLLLTLGNFAIAAYLLLATRGLGPKAGAPEILLRPEHARLSGQAAGAARGDAS